jgi:hypothetical protein
MTISHQKDSCLLNIYRILVRRPESNRPLGRLGLDGMVIVNSVCENNEKLHNFYSSPNIIRVIKSRRMRWVGYVARIGR